MTTEDKLNQLAEAWDAQDAMRLRYEEIRRSLIPPEIQAQLDELDAEKDAAMGAFSEGVEKLVAEIKAEVIAAGSSAKSERVQAVYAKGRVSWDSKALEGYAAAHPEITAFRKKGDPSVSIQWR